MSTTENKPTSKEYLNQLYDSQMESTKEQLTQAYNESASGLDSESEKLKKQRQRDLVQTDVEAQRAKRNYAEVQNAYGLSSGAMAQARLAQDNQHQNDLTDIRTAYAEADADVERRRQLLAQQFESAIKEAQANNDLARAQALYELAREEEAKLMAQQQAATTTPSGSSGGSSGGGNTGSGGTSGAPAQPSAPAPVVPVSPTISAQDYLDAAGVVGSVMEPAKKPVSPAAPSPSNTASDMPKRTGVVDKPSAVAKDVGQEAPNVPAATGYTVDTASISALGRGDLTEAELNRLIAAGEVEEYIVGNTIRFRNTAKAQSPAVNTAMPSIAESYAQAVKDAQSKKKSSGGVSGTVPDMPTRKDKFHTIAHA